VLLSQCHAGFIPLDETLAMDRAHRLVATPTAAKLLEHFAGMAIPADAAVESETNEFRGSGQIWKVRFAGNMIELRDHNGVGYLACLLAHPDENVHCAAIVAAATGQRQPVALGSSGPRLDAQAVLAYRRQMTELKDDIVKAQRDHDYGQEEALQAEFRELSAEVKAALGAGGRLREFSDADRFRQSVTMAIRRAIAEIGAVHPALGAHLKGPITTGRFCCYSPKQSVDWVV
jgi:hypothetical protein